MNPELPAYFRHNQKLKDNYEKDKILSPKPRDLDDALLLLLLVVFCSVFLLFRLWHKILSNPIKINSNKY